MQPENKINMKEGEVWKLNDALHSLLMSSANDAAFAIAERTSGTVEQFAKDADATARRLGARDTTFGDPAGLDDRNSFAGGTQMSAYDLAIVARNVLTVPEIANPAKLISYDFTDPAGAGRHLTNHNDGFLTTYPGATGLKTGFTNRREPHPRHVGDARRPHDDRGRARDLGRHRVGRVPARPGVRDRGQRARDRRGASRRCAWPPPTSAARRSKGCPPRSAGPRSTAARASRSPRHAPRCRARRDAEGSSSASGRTAAADTPDACERRGFGRRRLLARHHLQPAEPRDRDRGDPARRCSSCAAAR